MTYTWTLIDDNLYQLHVRLADGTIVPGPCYATKQPPARGQAIAARIRALYAGRAVTREAA